MAPFTIHFPPNPFASIILEDVPSFGAIEAGSAISMWFLGVATLQVWNYYRNYPRDPLLIKALVGVVFTLDLLHSLVFIHVTYHYTINGLVDVIATGGIVALSTIPWTLEASLMLVAAILLIVETYFCSRILRITGSRVLALGCFLLSIVRFGVNVALTITSSRDGTSFVVDTFAFKWQSIAEFSIGTATDFCIAMSMCIGLWRCRTGVGRTNHIVDRLVMYTLGNGGAASIMSIGALAAYLARPSQYIWVTFFGIISKVFSNSLLASLNQRGSDSVHSSTVHDTAGVVSTHLHFTPQQNRAPDVAELESMDGATSKPNDSKINSGKSEVYCTGMTGSSVTRHRDD